MQAKGWVLWSWVLVVVWAGCKKSGEADSEAPATQEPPVGCATLTTFLFESSSTYEGRAQACNLLLSCAGGFNSILLGKGVEATLQQGAPSLSISQGLEEAHCKLTYAHVEGAPVHTLEILDVRGGQGGIKAQLSTEALVYAKLEKEAKLSLHWRGEDLSVVALEKAELRGEAYLTGLLVLDASHNASTTLLEGTAELLVLGVRGGHHHLGGLLARQVEAVALEGAHAVVRASEIMRVAVASGSSVDYNKPAKCTYADMETGAGGGCF